LAVSTSATDLLRAQFSWKNTMWIGLVKSELTTRETTSRTDTNPAAPSLKNGSSTPDAARLNGSAS
jgi:hypothetical protein